MPNCLKSIATKSYSAGMAPFQIAYGTGVHLAGTSPPYNETNTVAFWAGGTGAEDEWGEGKTKFKSNPVFYVTYDGKVHADDIIIGEHSNVSASAIGNIPASKVYYDSSTPILTHINNNYVLKSQLDTLVNKAGYAKTADLSNYYSVEAAEKTEANIGILAAKVQEIISAVNNLIAPSKITNITIEDGLIIPDPNS